MEFDGIKKDPPSYLGGWAFSVFYWIFLRKVYHVSRMEAIWD